jgi:putative transposase
VNGRKRFILVDTLGLLWLIRVVTADHQECQGGRLLLAALQALQERFPRLRLIWADGGYAGQLEAWVADACAWVLEIVRKVKAKGFEVLPHRWIVERTFGWFGNFRRLSKDYEVLPAVSEAMLYWAMSHVMVRRLTGGQVRWKSP